MGENSVSSDVGSAIATLIHEVGYLEIVGHPRKVPGALGVFRPIPDTVNTKLRDYLQHKYPQGLFRHQDLAIRSIMDGNHTIVTTRTSSGKSAIYAVPMVNAMLEDDASTGLFIYPTRALANDQYLSIKDALHYVGIHSLANIRTSTSVAKYDGSTESHHRGPIRDNGRAILTNPDMLHIGILNNHELWGRFFRNLKYVIIDEAHEYRGVFGSNVAYLIRRLRQVCFQYKSAPVFVATSATCKNPKEHAKNLTGLDFHLIGADEDGSAQGRKTYFLTKTNGMPYIEAAANLALRLTRLSLSSLTFCPSRMTAEKRFYALMKTHPDLGKLMAVYRAGLSASQRELIERKLKERTLLGVLCTSALELGIDVGALDVVVLVGFPHTIMSMWQRAGRVGRAGKEGVVIVLASNNPVDHYFLNHQDAFYARENEPLTLTLTNPTIVTGHFACAKKEVGGDDARIDREIFGPAMGELADRFTRGEVEDSLLFQDAPHSEVTIRGIQDYAYRIYHKTDCIGDIGSSQVLREAYPFATYFHGGQKYRVKAIIDGERKIVVSPEPGASETRAIRRVDITNAKKLRIRHFHRVTLNYGQVVVRETVAQCYEVDEGGKPTGVVHPFKPRVRTFPSLGTWVDLSAEFLSALGGDLDPDEIHGGIHGIEHMLAQMLSVLVPCDANDYASKYVYKRGENSCTVYVYDNVHGGIGLSEAAFDLLPKLLLRAIEAIEACACAETEGCPFCIQQSGCELENASLSKRGAVAVGQSLHKTVTISPVRDLDFRTAPGLVAPSLQVGDRVFHQKFGIGSVSEITAEGEARKWWVVFHDGRRIPFADPALLSKVGSNSLSACRVCNEHCPPEATICPQCGNPLQSPESPGA